MFNLQNKRALVEEYTEMAPPSAIVVQKVFSRVFVWMAAALAITGITAYLIANSSLDFKIMTTGGLLWLFVIAELALVWILSSRISKLKLSTATILLVVYSILNGVTMSFIFLAYARTTIYSAFFITAGTFAAMAIVGYATKKDLSSFSRIAMMALIGLIIASVVNIFLNSSAMDWIISLVGVILFSVLTLIDVNQIKLMARSIPSDTDDQEIGKVAIMGTLSLYLDFVNLFLSLLRLLSSSQD